MHPPEDHKQVGWAEIQQVQKAHEEGDEAQDKVKRINFLTDLLILKVRLYNLRLDRCAVTKNAINVAIESLIMMKKGQLQTLLKRFFVR